MATRKERDRFNATETELLIKTRLKYEKEFASRKISLSVLWGKVLQDMRAECPGAPFSRTRVQRKFHNVMVHYKRIKHKNQIIGRATRFWKYFDQLDDVYGGKYSSSPPGQRLKTPQPSPSPEPVVYANMLKDVHLHPESTATSTAEEELPMIAEVKSEVDVDFSENSLTDKTPTVVEGTPTPESRKGKPRTETDSTKKVASDVSLPTEAAEY